MNRMPGEPIMFHWKDILHKDPKTDDVTGKWIITNEDNEDVSQNFVEYFKHLFENNSEDEEIKAKITENQWLQNQYDEKRKKDYYIKGGTFSALSPDEFIIFLRKNVDPILHNHDYLIKYCLNKSDILNLTDEFLNTLLYIHIQI